MVGVTPRLEKFYVSYHARSTYYVVGQTIDVPPEVAEQALSLSLVAGPVPKANCTRYTSRILRQLPGFEGLRQTWFPNKTMEDFDKLPGVVTQEYREDDADDKTFALAEITAILRGGQ